MAGQNTFQSFSLPTAIAYPVIVGLPPETGIYASMAAMVGYALFGPSRKLMVGLRAQLAQWVAEAKALATYDAHLTHSATEPRCEQVLQREHP
jgi:MFS superfamily sulfate permease-like transporter